MSSNALHKLEKTGELKVQPFSEPEFDGLMEAAACSLNDSGIPGLSLSGRFHLLYNAVHAMSLAALRRFGYRSDKRYLVFQCLQHTSALEQPEIRLLVLFHEKRNLAAYEGVLEADEQLLDEVAAIAVKLLGQVDPFGG